MGPIDTWRIAALAGGSYSEVIRRYTIKGLCIRPKYICQFNVYIINSSSAEMVLEAGYPSTTGFRKVVKATILVRKKPGMSDADFIEHYNHKHAQMAAPVLQKHNVITYSLVGLVNP